VWISNRPISERRDSIRPCRRNHDQSIASRTAATAYGWLSYCGRGKSGRTTKAQQPDPTIQGSVRAGAAERTLNPGLDTNLTITLMHCIRSVTVKDDSFRHGAKGPIIPLPVVSVRAACRAAQLYAGSDMHIGPHQLLGFLLGQLAARLRPRQKTCRESASRTLLRRLEQRAWMALVGCMRSHRVPVLRYLILYLDSPHRRAGFARCATPCHNLGLCLIAGSCEYEWMSAASELLSVEAVGRGIRQGLRARLYPARCKLPTSTPRVHGRVSAIVCLICV